MSPKTQTLTQRSRRFSDPVVKALIAKARKAPIRSPMRAAWALSGMSVVLLWASFTPLDWGPLAWIALVPLVLLVRLQRPTRWMYGTVSLCGLLYTLATLQWMRLGDPSMYVAWVLLAVYVAIYFPVFVALSRVAVHRFALPLTATIPIVWVGLEYLRAHLMTGFSWYYLGHTQYWWTELIQISDLVGAYGVSFVVALSAAVLAGLIPGSVLIKLKLLPADSPQAFAGTKSFGRPQIVSVAVMVTLFAAVLGYGYIRRSQADFKPGPRVALIQGNFTASVKHDPNEAQKIFNTHHFLTGLAIRHQPDLIVWPETMFRYPLLVASEEMQAEDLAKAAPLIPKESWQERKLVPESLRDRSQEAGAAMIVGIDTFQAKPDGVKHYNSAVFVRPDVGVAGRYDKIHRVIFGEYIPLKKYFPWLRTFTPFSDDFGIDRGKSAVVFDYRGWRFAPVICFEDTVPHLVRKIVRSASQTKNGDGSDGRIDCLVNLTNDGWFHGSSELDQHLITASFRAVECRTPMVRAVNTGVSAIIDGDGVIVEPDVFIDGDGQDRDSMRDPKTGRWHKQLNAVLVHTVPVDNRTSLYVRWGDWFAGTCGFGCLFLMFSRLMPVRRSEDC
ncbi:MAG: apolipoprotein N-acyltransferase [Planctomycetes bacterium]|nr:apolipoprotein N-acyltransferase [Planctomycetota bacterium]